MTHPKLVALCAAVFAAGCTTSGGSTTASSSSGATPSSSSASAPGTSASASGTSGPSSASGTSTSSTGGVPSSAAGASSAPATSASGAASSSATGPSSMAGSAGSLPGSGSASVGGSSVGTSGTASSDGAPSSAGQASSVGASSGAPASASVTLTDAGGLLVLGVLTLDIPAGAAPSGSALGAAVVQEDPGLPGVTPVTPVFQLTPAGTTFSSDVRVAFEVPGLPADAVPVVYWTDATGTFVPQPTWWSGGRVHSLTRHFSRAFVGKATAAPESLLCCEGTACANHRGVCLPRAPLAQADLGTGAVLTAEGITVRNQSEGAQFMTTVAIRSTPVHPMALGRPSVGPVLDVAGNLPQGATMQVCLTTTLTASQRQDACLGYHDEEGGRWKCEDSCLGSKDNQICGQTSHFTSFAILLSGGASTGAQCRAASVCPTGTVRCGDGACRPRAECSTSCNAGLMTCPDGSCVDPTGGTTCPASACSGQTPFQCSDGTCVSSLAQCPATLCPRGHTACQDALTCARSSDRCPG